MDMVKDEEVCTENACGCRVVKVYPKGVGHALAHGAGYANPADVPFFKIVYCAAHGAVGNGE